MLTRRIALMSFVCILMSSMLAACAAATPTEDVAMKFTEIASTVQAQLTQAAALTPSATPTLEATATPTKIPVTPTPTGPTSTPTKTPYPTLPAGATSKDNSKFSADVTIPDGTQVKPGETFVKTWRFKNTGSTTWSKDYHLEYLEGLTAVNSVVAILLPEEVKPGDMIEISATFTAPATAGTYTSWWRLYTANGAFFGDYCSMKIIVAN